MAKAKKHKRNPKKSLESFILYPSPSKETRYEGVSGVLAVVAIVFAFASHNSDPKSTDYDTLFLNDLTGFLSITAAIIAVIVYLWSINGSKDAFRHRDNFVSLCLLLVMVIIFILLHLTNTVTQ